MPDDRTIQHVSIKHMLAKSILADLYDIGLHDESLPAPVRDPMHRDHVPLLEWLALTKSFSM